MMNCTTRAALAAILGFLIVVPALAHPTGNQLPGTQQPTGAETNSGGAAPGYGDMPMYRMHHGMNGDMPMYGMHQQMHGGAAGGGSMPMYHNGPHGMHHGMPMWGSDQGSGAAAPPSGQGATKPDTK